MGGDEGKADPHLDALAHQAHRIRRLYLPIREYEYGLDEG
jgi:hypothetical protein